MLDSHDMAHDGRNEEAALGVVRLFSKIVYADPTSMVILAARAAPDESGEIRSLCQHGVHTDRMSDVPSVSCSGGIGLSCTLSSALLGICVGVGQFLEP